MIVAVAAFDFFQDAHRLGSAEAKPERREGESRSSLAQLILSHPR